jgi:hypothetical protein
MNWTGIIIANGATLLITMLGGAMAWQRVKDRCDENERRIEALEAQLACYEELYTKLAVLANDLQWIQKELVRRSNGRAGNGGQFDQGVGGGS